MMMASAATVASCTHAARTSPPIESSIDGINAFILRSTALNDATSIAIRDNVE